MKETLFYNGIIHTMVSEEDTASYMIVRDGKIAEMGKETPVNLSSSAIDLCGNHVYPCLIDSHVHMLLTIASMASGFNACEITSDGIVPNTLSGIKERIKRCCLGTKENAVLVFTNYITSAIAENRLPCRTELDECVQSRAVAVYNIDGHSMSLSSKMLELLGMDTNGNGILSGEENEQAQGKIVDIIGKSISLSDLSKGIACFQNKCAEYGIGTIGALEGNGSDAKDGTTRLIIALSRHFDIGVRIYLQYKEMGRVRPYLKLMKHKRVGGCGEWEMDGSVGSHSAAFELPFTDTKQNAPCYYTQDESDRQIKLYSDEGFQIAAHAIGECAVERLKNSLDKCENGIFHRIEHGEFLKPECFEDLKSGRYAIVMQPGYAWIDKNYLHSYEKYLDASILERMKFGSLLRSGVCVCGSSDSPVQDLDPYLQMLGMTSFYIESESVSPYEAMCSYTKNAAKAILEEDERGTLEPGKAADFFVADKDFFSLKPFEIADFRPKKCFYGGKEYKNKNGSLGELVKSLFSKAKML